MNIEDFNIQNDLSINRFQLDLEAVSLPSIYFRYSDAVREAKEIVSEMEKKLSAVKEGSSSDSTSSRKLYYEVWNAPFMTAGSRSFINDIIFTSGAENIFADIDEAYPIVSEETIIARQPEYILIPASCGITVEAVKARNGWASIPAVKNNKIFLIDDNVYTRPGPRVADVVVELNSLLQ